MLYKYGQYQVYKKIYILKKYEYLDGKKQDEKEVIELIYFEVKFGEFLVCIGKLLNLLNE